MAHLFHITTESAWLEAQKKGFYSAPSLETEGFIHFSLADQVIQTANRFYQGETGLILLEIEPTFLTAKLEYESVLDHGTFPHLYGSLNLDAVIAIKALERSEDGSFSGWH